jgi:hypothetical protein
MRLCVGKENHRLFLKIKKAVTAVTAVTQDYSDNPFFHQ